MQNPSLNYAPEDQGRSLCFEFWVPSISLFLLEGNSFKFDQMFTSETINRIHDLTMQTQG